MPGATLHGRRRRRGRMTHQSASCPCISLRRTSERASCQYISHRHTSERAGSPCLAWPTCHP
eukprot:365240-Chlamydomonas_euryale.AAC.10